MTSLKFQVQFWVEKKTDGRSLNLKGDKKVSVTIQAGKSGQNDPSLVQCRESYKPSFG